MEDQAEELRELMGNTLSSNQKEENPANIDELIQIVKEANKKRHPLPKSPFEKHEVDWHWSLIWELEKYNPVIKEVRKEEDYKKFMQQKTD